MTGDAILLCRNCEALITSRDLEVLRQFKAASLPYCQRCIERAMEARQKVATFEPTNPDKPNPKEPFDKTVLVPLQQLEVGLIAGALCAANMGEKAEEITERYFQAYTKRCAEMS